jgi:hypothetical protein
MNQAQPIGTPLLRSAIAQARSLSAVAPASASFIQRWKRKAFRTRWETPSGSQTQDAP